VRSRTPLALAALLIVALVATIGVAAFSTGIVGESTTTKAVTSDTLGTSLPISGRVASAVFAMSVTPERNAEVPESTTTTAFGSDSASTESADDDTTTDTTGETDTTVAATTDDPVADDEAAADDTADDAASAPDRDTAPPALRITSPKDGSTVKDRIVEIEGTTEPGASVFIGPYDADVDPGGDWAINVVLAAGPNGAVVTARDSAGNEAQQRIVVNYDAPETTTTKAPTTTKPKSTGTTQAPSSSPTTTKAPTTTKPPSTSSSGYSSQWPADGGGKRNVENWRGTVARYWPADRVDCVLGIMYRESRGDPRAHNRSSNAMGLMQHLLKYWPSRAKGAGFVDGNGQVADPFNGAANIAAGAWLANYYAGRGYNWWNPWSSLPNYGNCSG
jgi:hypothetical protein